MLVSILYDLILTFKCPLLLSITYNSTLYAHQFVSKYYHDYLLSIHYFYLSTLFCYLSYVFMFYVQPTHATLILFITKSIYNDYLVVSK